MKRVGLGVALSLSLTGPAFAQIEREYVNPWEKEIGYAQVVRHGDTLYLSGITASGASVAEQMTAIYGQIGKILKSRGLDSAAILSETIYTRDIEAVKVAIPVRKSFYKEGQYPASTWVQVERLFNPDLLIEIEVTAALKP